MTKKLNWKNARKYSGVAMKYETGTKLKNGEVVFNGPADDLATRARKAEARWLKKRGLTNKLTLHPNIRRARYGG